MHAWRLEEWPSPKPGGAPEQVIQNVVSYWLSSDGRLYSLEYEQRERFGWITHPTPTQGGPRGISLLGDPSVTAIDDVALDRSWEFLKSKIRSDEVNDAGHKVSFAPPSIGGYATPQDFLWAQLVNLEARPASDPGHPLQRDGDGGPAVPPRTSPLTDVILVVLTVGGGAYGYVTGYSFTENALEGIGINVSESLYKAAAVLAFAIVGFLLGGLLEQLGLRLIRARLPS